MKHFGAIWLSVCLLVVQALCLSSCDSEFVKPAASGRPYEVMVVVDDSLWQRPAGRALFNVLDTDIPGLPQPERSFRISQVHPDHFDKILNIFRNVIRVKINKKEFTRTKMKFVRDLFSRQQVVLTIQSPSEEEFAAYMEKHSNDIIHFFVRTEMNRLIRELHKEHSVLVADMARDMFDCRLLVPKEIQSYKKGQDFFWTSSNSASAMVNICMYAYPYEGPHTFNKEYVLAKRDSFMKANIPGSKPHMYMTTDTLCTTVTPITVKDAFALETRGLWQMKNDGMGGPFVSHSRVDTVNNRVVVVEGFVFAPEKMKRGLIRRLEGSLYTLNLPREKESELTTNIPEAAAEAETNQ